MLPFVRGYAVCKPVQVDLNGAPWLILEFYVELFHNLNLCFFLFFFYTGSSLNIDIEIQALFHILRFYFKMTF